MDSINKANIDRWDELAASHAGHAYYKVDDFLANSNFSTLTPLEQEEVGNIQDLRLLHLQCHIGTDTLSLARKGAHVTGVDYSEQSIQQARIIAQKAGIDAEFIQSDIYDMPQTMQKDFDVVYSNWGALNWLKDIPRWAGIVSENLKTGGTFYMAEIHPHGLIHARDSRKKPEERLTYFPQKEPQRFEYNHTYTGSDTVLQNKAFYQWPITMGDIVTSLIKTGLKIEFLHEHPFAVYKQMDDMVQLDNGLFVRPDDKTQVPFSFSLKATKP